MIEGELSMASKRSSLCIYFVVFLPTIVAESGSGAPVADGDACMDAESDTHFNCITQLGKILEGKHTLLCNVKLGTEMNMNQVPVNFTARARTEGAPLACSMESRWEGRCVLKTHHFWDTVRVCFVMPLIKPLCNYCQEIKGTDIVKPKPPFNLNITFQEEANEYLVEFFSSSSNDYLHGELIHEIAYRQGNTNWMIIASNFTQFKLLGTNFYPGAVYEVKARSKPNGVLFKGPWSEWSSPGSIQAATVLPAIKMTLLTAFVAGFLVLLIIIFVIQMFWKNRIKPRIWPALPNHEKTLAKLCNKLRKNSDLSVFNPESLGYAHIHKLDSIQAKSEMVPFQPWSAEVPEKMRNGLELKSPLNHINHGWLKLPLAYEGMGPAEVLNRQVGRGSNANGNALVPSAHLHGENGPGGCGPLRVSSTYASSLMKSNLLPGLQALPYGQAFAKSDMRLLHKEEAYVTMANFYKTKGN